MNKAPVAQSGQSAESNDLGGPGFESLWARQSNSPVVQWPNVASLATRDVRPLNYRGITLARPQGFEPWTSEIITLGTLTGLSYRRFVHLRSWKHDKYFFSLFRSVGTMPIAMACPLYGASDSTIKWRSMPPSLSSAASFASSASSLTRSAMA